VCPPATPKICDGTTVCAQCCGVTDCRLAGWNDFQECQNGQCVCLIPGKHRCPSDRGIWAGVCAGCCDDSECPGAEVCGTVATPYPNCSCPGATTCDLGNGDRVCVPSGCANTCFAPCNGPGQPQAGQQCCTGKGAWVCSELSPGDFRCAPPE
jgi:hypothetical protein